MSKVGSLMSISVFLYGGENGMWGYNLEVEEHEDEVHFRLCHV